MSNQEQSNAFNEVRAILGKLDRSIDEARSRRLEPEQPARREPPTNNNTPSGSNGAASRSDLDREIGAGAPQPAKTELQRKSATFGRAKPLNRGNGNDRPASGQWKSPGNDDDLIG